MSLKNFSKNTKPGEPVSALPNISSLRRALILQAVLFLALFSGMQLAWQWVRDDAVGHFFRGNLTVRPAVYMIHLLTPKIDAIANGNQIIATGGGIVIKIGCEGIEAILLLIAALLVAHLPLKKKLKGILIGSLFVYVLNQVRILALFYAFRNDKSLFYLLHGTIAPFILIILTSLFFKLWIEQNPHATPLMSELKA